MERTVASVSDALVRLSSDDALRNTLGTEAQRRVQMYSWEYSVGRVIDLYLEMLSQGTSA